MITYKLTKARETHIRVYVDGKWTGNIADAPGGGFHYIAKGGHTGETFLSIREVQASLEGIAA